MTSNYLEKHGVPWCFREDVVAEALKGPAFVINLDDRNGSGTHWTAARLLKGRLYYADPFGTLLNGWPPKEFAPLKAHPIVNSVTFQRPKSVLCGYYAMLFTEAMDTITQAIGSKAFEDLLYRSLKA